MSTDALAIFNTRRSTRTFAPYPVIDRDIRRFDESKVHRQTWGGR